MSILHIDPDHLYLTSRAFWQANYQAVDQLFRLRTALLRLELTWSSDTADEYVDELRSLLRKLQDQNEELISMSLLLSRQADLWDESDQRWSGVYREGFPFLPPGE